MTNAGVVDVLPEPKDLCRSYEMQVPGSMKSRKRINFIKVTWFWGQKDILSSLLPSSGGWGWLKAR